MSEREAISSKVLDKEKWMEAIPIPDQTSVTGAKEFVCRYGMPLELHSDQGSNFMSRVFCECHGQILVTFNLVF